MIKKLDHLLPYIAALLLGAVVTFAFAPYSIFPLAVIAPAGLLLMLRKASPKQAFWLGYLFGFGMFGAGVYWVFISIHYMGDVPNFLSALITTGLIALMALFPATSCYLTNRYFSNTLYTPVVYAFPAMWVLFEWIRSWLFTGFPWLYLGYSQTNSPLKGYAPLLSVYGVSLAVLFTSVLLVNAFTHFKQKAYQNAYLSLLIITMIWVTGGLLNLIPWTKPVGSPVTVSLVQGNIPQELKWVPEHVQLSFDRYTELTNQLWGKHKIIIWPEAAIPLSLQDAAGFIETMDEKAKSTGSTLILGIPIKAEDKDGYYNAVITLGAEKKVYVKRHLLPFGEYLPFIDVIKHVFNQMNLPIPLSVPGKYSQEPLQVGKLKLLTSVCYEIAFPELINTQDTSVGALLTVTNDAWFGKSSAQAQHLQMAEMRAVELGRPVLFASNDGITAIIGANGNVQAVAPTHEAYVLNGELQPMQGLTPWMKNGMDPVLFIFLCLFLYGRHATRANQATAKLTANNDQLILQKAKTRK